MQQLRDDLGPMEAWLLGGESENHKTLEANKAVWTTLQKIACKLSGVLSEAGFPPDQSGPEGITYDLVYKTPTYFIDREYCPSHIEAYWRAVQEHAQVAQALEHKRASQTRQELEARWNKIF